MELDATDVPTPSGRRVLSKSELAEALDCGQEDLSELQAAAKEVLARPLTVDPRKQLEKQRLFRRAEEAGPLAPGRWVRLEGLQAAGLNGREGLIVEALNGDGRIGVSIARCGGKLVRPTNLQPLPDEVTMKVARLFARGERRAGALTWRWPLSVLADRPSEVSPMAQQLGLPLYVTRVEPDRQLTGADQHESDWVAHLMMDPHTGCVRRPWHKAAGPVLVWRGDFEDFSADDLCLVVCFIDKLLLRYADKESPIDVDSEVTPEAFASFVSLELSLGARGLSLHPVADCNRSDEEAAEEVEAEGRSQWWEDVNLVVSACEQDDDQDDELVCEQDRS